MHESVSIANQTQNSPTAAANEVLAAIHRQPDPKTQLIDRYPIQLKLSVGAVNDPLEHEADTMADKVMRMPYTPFLQRKTPGPGNDYDDEHVRLKPLANQITPFIQAKGNETAVVSDSASAKIKSSMGAGSAMDTGTRSFMENRFGTDFGNVKIHNNAESEQLNRSLNAKAFTVSNNIYFNRGEYQPESNSGRHLLAHELTHVIQQSHRTTGISALQLKGHTAGGFFSNLGRSFASIFTSESGFDDTTLREYLKVIDTGEIEDDYNSDDKARIVVRRWLENPKNMPLTPQRKVMLIREMLSGYVSGSDQEAILHLLEGSNNEDLAAMFPARITYEEIHTRFGSLKSRLEFFETEVLKKLGQYEAPDPHDAKSIGTRLEDLEKQHGVEFKDFSVSFKLEAGDYYKSALVNLTAPEYGVTVTIKLTRTGLAVMVSPGLVVDLIWPIPNAELNGFSIAFAGLKTKLDIDGINLVSGIARDKVTEYIHGLLIGTRFADPAYDPTKDPYLVNELANSNVIGDIDRVKYNFKKNLEKDKKPKEDSNVPGDISGLSYIFNIVHNKGVPEPANGYGVMIPPGTKFRLSVYTMGTAAELLKKQNRLLSIHLDTDGIFLYKGNVKLAVLHSIKIDRGLKFKLEGIETFVDLKELARQESPQWARGAVDSVTGAMKSYDEAVDTFHSIVTLGGLLGSSRKSNVAEDVAVSAAETFLGMYVHNLLYQHWQQIQIALSVSDQQISDFFGLNFHEDSK